MKHVKGRLDESILVCVYYGRNGERLIRRGHKMVHNARLSALYSFSRFATP